MNFRPGKDINLMELLERMRQSYETYLIHIYTHENEYYKMLQHNCIWCKIESHYNTRVADDPWQSNRGNRNGQERKTMTREELAAGIADVLELPQRVNSVAALAPARLASILALVDAYTGQAEAAAWDAGFKAGAAGDQADEADRLAKRHLWLVGKETG